ncbi:hypothetical protein ACFL42_01450 [Candidatus Omnitrophota bacterium]
MKRTTAKKRINPLAVHCAVALCLIAAFFFPSGIKQGIDGQVRLKSMPLGIKVMEFVTRDFEYRWLAGDICRGSKTDKEKALAVFAWVLENINIDHPRTWSTVDDHILNIIIRRYATADQRSDVFATLCTYAGVKAFWDKIRGASGKDSIILTFVRIDGAFRPFDVYRGIYFVKADGEIAGIKDIENKDGIMTDRGKPLSECRVDYAGYLLDLKPVSMKTFTRAARQMPVSRIMYEIGRLTLGKRHVKPE